MPCWNRIEESGDDVLFITSALDRIVLPPRMTTSRKKEFIYNPTLDFSFLKTGFETFDGCIRKRQWLLHGNTDFECRVAN